MIDKIKRHKEILEEKAKISREKIKNELRASTSTAIVAAFGFLIAMSWKDVITEFVDKIAAISPMQGKLINAGLVTIISVIGIVIATELLAPKKNE
jgi:hypothetical protein